MGKPLAVSLAAAALLAGCGGDDGAGKVDRQEVESVVTRFAEADDASACDLMTDEGLVAVYGGFTSSPEKAKATCVRKAAKFKGEPVEITEFNPIDSVTAKVGALRKDGQFTYSVTLRRPDERWLIDEINQYRVR